MHNNNNFIIIIATIFLLFLHTRHCARFIKFNPQNSSARQNYYSHLRDEETEAYRDQALANDIHNWCMAQQIVTSTSF